MPNNFDFLRLLAATMVLISHQYPLSGQDGSALEIFPDFPLGSLAVSIFFSISGYLVTQSWIADPHLWRFLAKRILRIIPALACVTLAAIFIVGPLTTSVSLGEYFSAKTTWQYLHNVHLKIKYELPGVFLLNPYPKAVNGSLWTLPAEFKWYLVVAALGMAKIYASSHC